MPTLDTDEREQLKKIFGSPLDVPQEWVAWIIDKAALDIPQVPLAQAPGGAAVISDIADINFALAAVDTEIDAITASIAGLTANTGAITALSAALQADKFITAITATVSVTSAVAETAVNVTIPAGALSSNGILYVSAGGSIECEDVANALTAALFLGATQIASFSISAVVSSTADNAWGAEVRVRGVHALTAQNAIMNGSFMFGGVCFPFAWNALSAIDMASSAALKLVVGWASAGTHYFKVSHFSTIIHNPLS